MQINTRFIPAPAEIAFSLPSLSLFFSRFLLSLFAFSLKAGSSAIRRRRRRDIIGYYSLSHDLKERRKSPVIKSTGD